MDIRYGCGVLTDYVLALFDSSIGYSIFVSFLKITPVNFKLFPIITVVFALVFITLSFVAS